ncbi:uncharacterized protein ACBT44_014323 [Syngnathus typhle]
MCEPWQGLFIATLDGVTTRKGSIQIGHMSVTFNRNLGVLTGDGWELMESKSNHAGRFSKPACWIGAVAVCLGLLYLLLLVVIIAMVGQYIRPSPLTDAEHPPSALSTCQNVTSQYFQLQGRYNTLSESNKQLETKICSLTKEKGTVEGERDLLQNQRDALQNQRDVLESERNVLHDERDALKIERGTIRTELDTLHNEQEVLKNERDTFKDEHDVLKTEEEKLEHEVDTLKNEKETLEHERDTLRIEQEVLKSERDTLKNDKSSLHKEQEVLKNERDNLKNEKDILQKEQEALKRERDALKNEKVTLQTERDGLRAERDNLTVERDQLKSVSSNLTNELEVLQSRFSKVVASRDGFKEEAHALNKDRTEKLCPTNWVKFKEKCYFISDKGNSNSWRLSRKQCQDRGGDLVIVTSKEEQDFIVTYYDRVWIGLSDLAHEGKWKWVNGDELNFDGFWQKGEPNDDSSSEDCVELSRSGQGWNDLPCSTELGWICEDE